VIRESDPDLDITSRELVKFGLVALGVGFLVALASAVAALLA
jgi:hypothetical protein